MTMSMCVRSAQHGGGACAARCGARVRGDQKATERKSEVSRRALGFVGTCAQQTAAGTPGRACPARPYMVDLARGAFAVRPGRSRPAAAGACFGRPGLSRLTDDLTTTGVRTYGYGACSVSPDGTAVVSRCVCGGQSSDEHGTREPLGVLFCSSQPGTIRSPRTVPWPSGGPCQQQKVNRSRITDHHASTARGRFGAARMHARTQ